MTSPSVDDRGSASRSIEPEAHCAGLPAEILKQLRGIEFRTRQVANEQLSGTYSSVFKGQGLSFREVRGYLPGDDVRWIDWNVSARMNEPFVKVFVEEREMTVMLVVDLSRREQFGTARASKRYPHRRRGHAALCAFSAIKNNNDRIGLILGTDASSRNSSRRRRATSTSPPASCARSSATSPSIPAPISSSRSRHLVKVTKRKSVAVVVSDFYATGFERALALAGAKHDVIPVMLVDPRDEELPDVGLVTLRRLRRDRRGSAGRHRRRQGPRALPKRDAHRPPRSREALSEARARLGDCPHRTGASSRRSGTSSRAAPGGSVGEARTRRLRFRGRRLAGDRRCRRRGRGRPARRRRPRSERERGPERLRRAGRPDVRRARSPKASPARSSPRTSRSAAPAATRRRSSSGSPTARARRCSPTARASRARATPRRPSPPPPASRSPSPDGARRSDRRHRACRARKATTTR